MHRDIEQKQTNKEVDKGGQAPGHSCNQHLILSYFCNIVIRQNLGILMFYFIHNFTYLFIMNKKCH